MDSGWGTLIGLLIGAAISAGVIWWDRRDRRQYKDILADAASKMAQSVRLPFVEASIKFDTPKMCIKVSSDFLRKMHFHTMDSRNVKHLFALLKIYSTNLPPTSILCSAQYNITEDSLSIVAADESFPPRLAGGIVPALSLEVTTEANRDIGVKDCPLCVVNGMASITPQEAAMET